MSVKKKAAIAYGVGSILLLGFTLGLLLGGAGWWVNALTALITWQFMFYNYAMGYSSGRADAEKEK